MRTKLPSNCITREQIINYRREQTYDEAIKMLNKKGKCAIIRPTGFGKTGTLTKIINKFKHVIYLYPTEIIQDTVLDFYYNGTMPDEKTIDNVTFVSYRKLIMLKEDEIERKFADVDLIISDECHKLGASETIRAMKTLITKLPNAKLLGATATPERMDLIDEISIFFDNNVISQYTLHDAFEEGVLIKPYYCFCGYGNSKIEQDYIASQTRLEIEKMDIGRESAIEMLRSRLIEIANISKMDNIIRETCNKYLNDVSYMRYIVFFSSFNHMHEQEKQVKKWFKNAYPTHKIKITVVSSENEEFSKNVSNLANLKRKENTIDLVFCCDMLNMGYHINDLTGIVMFRGTESGIIYSQQLGRTLSSGNDKPGIVFDIVDNIHREALYEVLGKKPTRKIDKNGNNVEIIKEIETSAIAPENEQSGDEIVSSLNEMEVTSGRWWVHANDIYQEDLIATGYEATYRELIAKTVAEPISMRCRQAWARWIEKGGIPSKSASEVLGQLPPESVPLSPFARCKQVSVERVLQEMGVL